MTTDIKLLPLPEVLLNWPHPTNHVAIRDYARACVAHATAAKDAEIEALRAEAIEWRGLFGMAKARADKAETRAERLAEALREIERSMPEGQAGPAWIARGIVSEALLPAPPKEAR